MILISFAFCAGLLMFFLFVLLKAFLKNTWPSLYDRLINKKIYLWLAAFPFYILCFYILIQLSFTSPLFMPPIAKIFISQDLKRRYNVNFKVLKIEKNISNQFGESNTANADVQIKNSKNVFRAHYGLSFCGIIMEYCSDDINDYYISQSLTKFLKDETEYKEILCCFSDYSDEVFGALLEPNANLQNIACNNRIEGSLVIYDFYKGKTNYDRIYNIIYKLCRINFEDLSICYKQYDPKKTSYIAYRLKRNIGIGDNKALSSLDFDLDEVRVIENANLLSEKLKK